MADNTETQTAQTADYVRGYWDGYKRAAGPGACPTPCDDDCDADCHEGHDVFRKHASPHAHIVGGLTNVTHIGGPRV